MAREASLQELLTSAFDSQMSNMYTSIPCIVVGVRDGLSGQMVDIQPAINQKLVSGVTKERPPILGVPVQFPVSKLSGITFPIKVGDTGLAVFSMRNMDTWKSGTGKPSVPANSAKMDKGDAVFIPGIQPPGIAVNNPAKHSFAHSTEDVVVFHNLGSGNEVEIRLKQDGKLVINTSQKPVEINCSDATVNASTSISLISPQMNVDVDNTSWIGNINLIGNLTQTGNYTATGTLTFNGINFSTHKHTGVMTGPATSTGPTN
jgi:hypothetical protein